MYFSTEGGKFLQLLMTENIFLDFEDIWENKAFLFI